MARRKSSRGRVFYYPSSLPKMQVGGDTNQENDEYSTTLDLISTYKGHNPSAMREALNKIAWHETGMTLNPKQLQGNDPKKPGKGLYQFEKDSLVTAIQRAKNFYKSVGEPVPDWINNLNTTDATTLSASQQSSLAALDMVQRNNFPVRQALENEEGLVEAWAKGWQTKNDPVKKALFKEHLEIYKDKGIKTELPTVTFFDPIRSLPKFKNGSRIGNGTEDTEKVPIRVDVANESTTWNPKFTNIINNPSNYSQAEVIDAIQKMSALFPDSDKIITTPGVSPSEAGIRYVEKDPATGLPKLKSGGIPERYKNKGFTKVGAKKQSTRPGKKWMVLAKKGDDYKVVHGGYKGMKDFSQHGSEDRKKKFWSRMGGKNSSKAQDPFSPLYWHKRFGTWEYGGDIQQQGYKDNSPYKNRPYIDIYSNNITMDGVSQPLLVKTDTGQEMILDPNSGEYYFPGANVVREMPLKDIPSYFSGSKINLTKYQSGGQLPEKADSEVYRLYLSGKHLKQGYPWAEQQGTGRAYPDAREVSPEFEYQGDKHWNVKRFAYAPFFGRTENDGYHYNNIGIYTDENYQGPTTVPLEVGKNKKEQRKLLTEDMTKYYLGSGYSEDEALDKAKTFVKDEVMPLVNSKYHKMSKNHPIKRVDQFDAPSIYSQMLITPGEKRMDNYFYDKETLKKLNEGNFKSGRKIKRLDKDFNITFRGKSKKDAKAEAKTNYKNFKDSKYTISDFKKDKKERSFQNTLSDGGESLFQEYQIGGQLPRAEIMIDPATGLPKLKKGGKAWIQGAIKKPGALKATAKRAGAIKPDGTIKKSWLREKAKGSGKTAQRARLAITLGKMKK